LDRISEALQREALKGWLAEEGSRVRYCYREKGKIVAVPIEPEALPRYRRRLRAGRVVAAIAVLRKVMRE
jgi:hypothetical protein